MRDHAATVPTRQTNREVETECVLHAGLLSVDIACCRAPATL